jgi:N-acetylglucosaminyldiphosphoundecaprenol N-acetyl-beta-D-mannosaminyltransferase
MKATTAMAFDKVPIDGVTFTACRTSDVEGLLIRAVDEKQEPFQMVTVNLDILRLSHEDQELAHIIKHSRYNFADGWPLVQAAAMLGRVLPERVTGADLTPLICQWAGVHGWKVAFVGGSEQTRDILRREIPGRFGQVVVGHWIPDYRSRPIRDPELCEAIKGQGADIILVALGCPRQERWIWHNLAETGARAAMGVGGSLDFMAGVQQRAPRVVQRLQMEWFYRALHQPRRLGPRYLRDAWFFQGLMRRTMLRRWGISSAAGNGQ